MAYRDNPALQSRRQNGVQPLEVVPSEPTQKPRCRFKRVVVPAPVKPPSHSDDRQRAQRATAKAAPAPQCAPQLPEDEYPPWLEDDISNEDADVYQDDHDWSAMRLERDALDKGKRKHRRKRRSYGKMSKSGYHEVRNLLLLIPPSEWIERQCL